jgi:predicted metal-dependent hydrolase
MNYISKEHEGIGIINYYKSNKNKRITIILKPFKGIEVRLPYRASYENAFRIVESKREWIISNLPKIREIEEKQKIFTFGTIYKTRFHTIFIEKTNKLKPYYRKNNNNEIVIRLPENIDISTAEIQNYIKKVITIAFLSDAKKYLPLRVKYLAEKYNFTYNKLSFRNSKTRWGSCSSKNNISLSVNIMKLPDHLIDFVILHELVHTKIKNHSAEFWQKLDNVCENSKYLKKELKQYHIYLF